MMKKIKKAVKEKNILKALLELWASDDIKKLHKKYIKRK